MELSEITTDKIVYPGEYVFYEPTQRIVLVGSYNAKNGCIRALMDGKYLEDKLSNFKKIHMKTTERKKFYQAGCQKCKKKIQ